MVALLLGLPVGAQVQGEGLASEGLPGKGLPSTARHYVSRVDADGDGWVSLSEYQDWMGYGFAAMDRDHDGVLAAAELPGGRGQPLTRDAHRQRLAAGFHRQDRNGDGRLDAGEFTAPPR